MIADKIEESLKPYIRDLIEEIICPCDVPEK